MFLLTFSMLFKAIHQHRPMQSQAGQLTSTCLIEGNPLLGSLRWGLWVKPFSLWFLVVFDQSLISCFFLWVLIKWFSNVFKQTSLVVISYNKVYLSQLQYHNQCSRKKNVTYGKLHNCWWIEHSSTQAPLQSWSKSMQAHRSPSTSPHSSQILQILQAPPRAWPKRSPWREYFRPQAAKSWEFLE